MENNMENNKIKLVLQLFSKSDDRTRAKELKGLINFSSKYELVGCIHYNIENNQAESYTFIELDEFIERSLQK